jgi:hypothetical protein
MPATRSRGPSRVAPRRACALGALLALLTALGAAGPARGETSEPRPEFRVFPAESLELKSAQVGSKSNGVLTFENSGNTTLEIKAVRTPSAPFEAANLPSKGHEVRVGEEIIVEVTFKPTASGKFQSSLALETEAGLLEVSLSADGLAATTETSSSSPPTLPTPASLGSPQAPATAAPSAGPPPDLSALRLRASAAKGSGHRWTLLVGYTLSAPATVRLTVERALSSRHCARGAHTCTRWERTSVKRSAVGHPGHDSATLSLAALGAGEYRLSATPSARAGASGRTRRLTFKLPG